MKRTSSCWRITDVCRCVFVHLSRVYQLHSEIVWYLQESCTRPEASAAAQACWLSRLQTQVVHAPQPTAMFGPCPAPLSSSLIAPCPGPRLLPSLSPALRPSIFCPSCPLLYVSPEFSGLRCYGHCIFQAGCNAEQQSCEFGCTTQFDHLRLWVS